MEQGPCRAQMPEEPIGGTQVAQPFQALGLASQYLGGFLTLVGEFSGMGKVEETQWEVGFNTHPTCPPGHLLLPDTVYLPP